MSVGCTCARRTVPIEDAGGRSSPPGAPSSLPPSPHHLPIPSLHVLAALSTFSPPCSPLLLPSRGERDSDAHNKSSSRGSFFKPHFILTRTGAQTRARVKPRNCGCSKCDSAQQTTWVLCVRARARACVLFLFFFSFLFLVGSGGEGGGGGERAAIWNACVYVSFVTRYLWLTTGSVSPVRTTLQLRPKFF